MTLSPHKEEAFTSSYLMEAMEYKAWFVKRILQDNRQNTNHEIRTTRN
jgi:hypothetical protein